MNSYLKREQGKTTKLNIDAASFNPQRLEMSKQQPNFRVSAPVTRPKADRQTHAAHFQPPTLKHHLSELDPQSSPHNNQMSHGTVLSTEGSSGNRGQNNVLDIMKKQN